MKNFILLLAFSAFIFSSCKKKDKTNDCSLTEANFAGNYKPVSVKYKASASSPEVDYTSQYFETCELDDVTTFKTDHTYVYTDAGTVCVPDGNDSGSWGISSSVLTIDGQPITLENYTCKGFSATASDNITPGDKTTINFARQ